MAISLEERHRPKGPLRLFVNPHYFRDHPIHFAGVLLHEIHHVLLGHLTDRRLHEMSHKQAMEIAMEVSANEFIAEPLPAGAIVWKMFKRHGLRPFQSTKERYLLLARAAKAGRLKLPPNAKNLDEHRLYGRGAPGRSHESIGDAIDRRSSTGRPPVQRAGLGLPTHPDDLRVMRELIEKHLGGKKGGGTTRVPKIENATRQDSRRPSPWAKNRAMLSWPILLDRVFRTQRQVTPSYLRPNRRFPARLGEVPGRKRRPPRPHLLVGVDTSGSMSDEVLGLIARELDRLALHTKVTIAESDSFVHRAYELRQPLHDLLGGGDTHFSPVLELGDRTPAFQGVVYFTDGKGEWPKQRPRVPVLWVLTNEDGFDCPYGHVVRLPVRTSQLWEDQFAWL